MGYHHEGVVAIGAWCSGAKDDKCPTVLKAGSQARIFGSQMPLIPCRGVLKPTKHLERVRIEFTMGDS